MKLARLGTIFVVMLLSGCVSYRLDRTEQLYLAQSYLPLPTNFALPDGIPSPQRYAGAVESGCAGPHVPKWREANGRARATLQVLPGMSLLVTETSYRRNAAEAIPMASQWSWTLPRTGACTEDADWSRDDLLAVRHLLSGARLQDDPATPDTDYYLQLVRAAGCPTSADQAAGTCSFSQVRSRLLEPFISSMQVSYRRTGLNFEENAKLPTNDGFPEPHAAVLAVPIKGNDLGGWLLATASPQSDDFFRFALPPELGLPEVDVGELCAGLHKRRDALPVYVDPPNAGITRAQASREGHRIDTASIPVCQFNLKTLSLEPARWWPGGAPPVGSEVDLLASSDPMMLFRPPAYRKLLDSSGRRLCPPSTPAGTACSEDERLSQGFVDFDTLIELYVEGQREPVRVPAAMSVAQFERRHGMGMQVVSLTRQAAWLPQEFTLVDLNRDHPNSRVKTSALVAEQGLTLLFMPERSEQWRRKSGVYLVNGMKPQVILAPGDRITLKR